MRASAPTERPYIVGVDPLIDPCSTHLPVPDRPGASVPYRLLRRADEGIGPYTLYAAMVKIGVGL